VMLTQQNMEQIEFLSGNKYMLIKASSKAALPTWSEKTVDFLSAFSRNLLYHKRSHDFPDIMSYAFWIRRASLKQIKEHYYPKVENKIVRGVAFHIAPSNVPINFAVSFTSALLAGANVSMISALGWWNFEVTDVVTDNYEGSGPGADWNSDYDPSVLFPNRAGYDVIFFDVSGNFIWP